MPNNINDTELRSEEVQEILSAVPNWMIRWGNLLVLALIIMILCISWVVKYPDIVTAEAMITTQIPPQKALANTTGSLTAILVSDKDLVTNHQSLAIIENSADYKDVFKLKSIIETVELNDKSFNFPIDKLPILLLGDIEPQYALFENSYLKYKLYGNLNSGSNEIKGSHSLKTSNDTSTNHAKEEKILLKNVILSFNKLKKNIIDWENKFILKSNISGKISFLNYWRVNQTVNQGDLMFIIIPDEKSSFVAKLKSSAHNLGKIKKGQKVNIKLEIYPDTEFGTLQGYINSISIVPNKDGLYLISVELPSTLITSYNKTIEFKQEMKGSAEIITEDLRLIERFFYQFKSVLNR